jgi:hypothetical protein
MLRRVHLPTPSIATRKRCARGVSAHGRPQPNWGAARENDEAFGGKARHERTDESGMPDTKVSRER